MSYQSVCFVLSILFALLAGGCGGGSSGTGSFESGLAPSRKIASLTVSEYRSVCERIREATLNSFEQNKNGFCTFGALLGAVLLPAEPTNPTTVVACNQVVTDCLGQPIEEDDEDECFLLEEGIPGCDASARELEGCVTETLSSFATALNSLDCSIAASGNREVIVERVSQTLGTVAESPVCRSIAQRCPELFDSNAEES